jgi:VanZ family protein
MALTTDAIYHLSLLFILSIIVLPLKRSSLVALVLAIPALTEIVQFFMPGRVPDFMDAFHGYLGIILAYCLVQMWREIAPVVKKFRLQIRELGTEKQAGGSWQQAEKTRH